MMDEVQPMKMDRRRRRPALSCVSCRRSKIRCDRNLPCGACVRSKHRTCVYEPQGPMLPRQSDISSGSAGPHQPTDGVSGLDSETAVSPVANGPTNAHHGDGFHEENSTVSLTGSTPVDSTSSQVHEPSFDVKSLLDRIRELERRLEESTGHHASPRNVTRTPNNPPDPIAIYPSYLAGELHTMSKSVMSKTRYLGQSHWMNQIGNFKSVLEIFDQQCREKKTEPIALINKGKTLARTIKEQRTPTLNFKFGTNIPSRAIADKLVDGYLRTSETLFRVLHIPAFKKEYEAFWSSPESVDLSFILQLQLVMAIGSAVYDERYTMRKTAIQWVYEAQCWLISPDPKSRLTLSGLQVMLLLCLAEEVASVGPDLVWIPVGQLVRTAIFMGLHKDPKRLPSMSRYHAEMRRRIWNTILELSLQSSMDSGGPPLIYPESYDTSVPTNFDDEQLTAPDDAPPTINPPDRFTDMSIALAFQATFSARLAVARSLNDIGAPNTYEDTIRLHGQLSTAYKSLSQRLQRFATTDRQPTDFQRRLVDFLVRRYFMALHLPYLGPAMSEPAYAFSRKVVVEISAKLYSTVFPSAASNPRRLQFPLNGLEILPADGDDLARLVTSGSGMFRCIISQTSMAIGFELQNQLQEDDILGLPSPRVDLLNILRDSAAWIFGRILVGETNIKGYMFSAALLAQAEALANGLRGTEFTDAVVKAGREAVREALEALKQLVGPNPDDATNENDVQFNFDTMMAMDEEWEYDPSMQNILFNFTSIDSMLGTTAGAADMISPDFSQWQ
ncbi:hypothetical protein M426DRAFT_321349 [Hypoxylon sp. CI-4A]|nr:hypothetical protein M426DRAFT_321349 [Hypoxylon sp. CI-4A]